MTASMTTEPRASLVEVEQVDRDAAAAALRAVGRGLFAEHLDAIAERFARHRLEALRTQGDGERNPMCNPETNWLVHQLEAWPNRVDPERTTNIQTLMQMAAKLIRSTPAQGRSPSPTQASSREEGE